MAVSPRDAGFSILIYKKTVHREPALIRIAGSLPYEPAYILACMLRFIAVARRPGTLILILR